MKSSGFLSGLRTAAPKVCLALFLTPLACVPRMEQAQQRKLETRADENNVPYLYAEALVLAHKTTGKQLALIDMVHVGDETFYRSVEEFFERMSGGELPAVVLSEGIRCTPDATGESSVLQVIDETKFDPAAVEMKEVNGETIVQVDYLQLKKTGFAGYGPCSSLPHINGLHEKLAQSLGVQSQTTYPFDMVKELVKQKRLQVRSGDLDLADPRFRDEALLYSLFVARSHQPPLYEKLFTQAVAHKLANWAGDSFILRSRNQVLAENITALLADQTIGTVIVPWGAEHFEAADGSLLDLGGLQRVDFARERSEKLPVLKCVPDPNEDNLARLQRGMLCNQHRSEEEKKAAQAARLARREAERAQGTDRKIVISNPSRFGEPQITIEDGRIWVDLEYTEGRDLKREFLSCELKATFFSTPDADGGSRIHDQSLTFIVMSARTQIKKSFRRPKDASELALSLRCEPHPEERDLGRHLLTPVAEPPARTNR